MNGMVTFFFSREVLHLLPLPPQKQDPGTRCIICASLRPICVTSFGTPVFVIHLTILCAFYLFPTSLRVSFDLLLSVAGDIRCGFQFSFQRARVCV
jgi:hypothetical protein